MNITEAIIISLMNHFYLVSFVTGLLNEEAVLFLTIIASRNDMHLQIILLLAPLGLICIDVIYAYVGRLSWPKKIGEKIGNIGEQKGLMPKLIRLSHRHPLLALIFTKFVYGTRMPLIVYYRARGMRFRKFIVYELISIEIWAIIMIPLAWFAGKGFTSGLHIVRDFSKIVAIALLLVVLWYIISLIIGKLFLKKQPLISLK